jgi:hypothetical protein
MPCVYLTRLSFAEKDLAKAEGARWDDDKKLWYVENPIAHKACMRWCADDTSPFDEERDWRYFKFEDNPKAMAERCRYCPVDKAWWKPSLTERREYAKTMAPRVSTR